MAPKLALETLLLGRQSSGLEGAGGGEAVGYPLSEPGFRGDCIVVFAEERLEVFGSLAVRRAALPMTGVAASAA